MRTAILALAALAASTAPLFAADDIQIISLDQTTGSPSGWSGFYIGTTGGYGWLRDVDSSFVPPLVSNGEDWVFGVHAGYLHQWNQFLVGAELDYTYLDIQFDGFPIWAEDATTARVRAAFAWQRFLFSAHAGATYATTNIGLADWGYNLGLAAEYMVSDNITAGLQYDHHAFDSFDNTLIDATVDTLKLRIGYKF